LYANGDPINFNDPDGRCASAVFKASGPTIFGTMQAYGGYAAAGSAAALAAVSTGVLVPAAAIGGVVLGMDQCVAGIRTVWSGNYIDSGFSQILQSTGMSSVYANWTDSAVSMVCSMGTTALKHVGKEVVTQASRPATSSVSALLLKNKLIAEKISGGHSYAKHVILQKEFPGFSRRQFESHIRNILNNPSEMKNLSKGRTGYWDEISETVIVRNPFAKDGGTAFRPTTKKEFYDGSLK